MRKASVLGKICLGALMATAAIPAFAQDYPDEIVVTSRGDIPADADTLSQVVYYNDLDLGTYAGMEELRYRVRTTANAVCNALGEDRSIASPTRSCATEAYRSAMNRLGTDRQDWAPRGTVWLASR